MVRNIQLTVKEEEEAATSRFLVFLHQKLLKPIIVTLLHFLSID